MDVSKHLEKAAEAVKKKNFDYAIELYSQVLQLKPDHGEARRELRHTLVRRAEYKKIPKAIATLQGAPGRLSILFGGITRNVNQVILSAEKALRDSPRDPGLNRQLAEALEKAGHLNSAVAVWEFMGDHEEIGDEALKRAGALYYQLREFTKALGCFETVLARTPRDSEAEKMRKNLAAEGVLSSGSYDPTKSSRDLARDKDKQRALESDQKMVTGEDERTQQRNRLAETLAQDPANRRARSALVEHHVKGREYKEAMAVLDAGLALDPDSYELRERRGDLKILDLERQIRDCEQKALRGDEAAKTDLADLRREKLECETEEYSRRVADHPTDLDMRYKLARLMLDTGKIDGAIENLQQSVKDPRRRVDSLLGLGQAFEKKGLLDLARKQLDQALEATDPLSERGVEIRYTLGCLLERAGDYAGARDRFDTIYERDIHYKDVAARLDRLRAASPATSAPRPEPPRPEPPRSDAAPELEFPAAAPSARPAAPPPAVAPSQSRDEPPADSASTYGFKD
jgi:tetratricopeptide (TPR) repeat protein